MTNASLCRAARAAGERFFTPAKPCGACGTNRYYSSTGYGGVCVQCQKLRATFADKRPRKTDKRVTTQRMTACTNCYHEQHKPRAMGGDHSLECPMCGQFFDSSDNTWLVEREDAS